MVSSRACSAIAIVLSPMFRARCRARMKILFYAAADVNFFTWPTKNNELENNETSRGDDSEHRAAGFQFCDEDMIDPRAFRECQCLNRRRSGKRG